MHPVESITLYYVTWEKVCCHLLSLQCDTEFCVKGPRYGLDMAGTQEPLQNKEDFLYDLYPISYPIRLYFNTYDQCHQSHRLQRLTFFRCISCRDRDGPFAFLTVLLSKRESEGLPGPTTKPIWHV